MIHKLDGQPGYVISSRRCWLPGVYATERAARYAFRFPNALLEALTDLGRPITSDDLKATKREPHTFILEGPLSMSIPCGDCGLPLAPGSHGVILVEGTDYGTRLLGPDGEA